MSIVRIDYPNPAPVGISDWEDIIDVAEFLALGVGNPVDYDFSSNTIKQGVQILIGGSVYQSTTATAITGTPSDYVRITPAGATASAAYVASLAGVTWNSVYNHYKDGSGNAYLFNEAKAGLASPKTVVGKFAELGYMQKLLIGTTVDSGLRLVVADTIAALPAIDSSVVALFQNNSLAGQSCNISIIAGNASVSGINFGDSDLETPGIIQYVHGNNSMRFRVNSAEAMRITNTQNVLIKTTSDPGEGLHVGAGGMRVTGTLGAVLVRSSGDQISYDKAGENYLRAGTAAGFLAIITNGRAAAGANANLICNSDQSVTVNTTLYVDTIAEKTAAAGVTIDSVLLKDNTVTASGLYSTGFIVGDDPISGVITPNFSSSLTYEKVAEMYSPGSGTVRLRFGLKVGNVLHVGSGRIYINGIAVGAEHTTSSLTTVFFTDDLAISNGDLVQLYVKNTFTQPVTASDYEMRGGSLTLLQQMYNGHLGRTV